jgi:Domain of unknown function (DUF4386)
VSGSAWTGIAGIVFVLAFVMAALLLGEQLGSVGDPDRQFEGLYENEEDRRRDILGGLLLGVAGLAFAWFLNDVCSLLRDGTSANTRVSWLAFGCGLLFVAMLFAGGAALISVASSLEVSDVFDEDPHAFGPDVARLGTQLGYVMIFLYGAISAALAIGAIAIASLRSKVLPAWTGVIGLITAVLLALSFFVFMPIFVLPVWVLLMSVVMLLHRGPRAAPRASPP